MRSLRLLTVAVLAVILALSSTQSAFAQRIFLNPSCGPPGTVVSFSGSNYGNSEHEPCSVSSSPLGLISLETCTITNRELDSLVSGTFVVAAGASGYYLVTVETTGRGDSASAGFTAGDCPAVGGVVEPVNKLVIFAPYLALFGLVATVAAIVGTPWKKHVSNRGRK